MKLHCISDLEYNQLVFKLVFQNRGFDPTLRLSLYGVPSIGYGFDLRNEDVFSAVLESLGFDTRGQHLKDQALEAERYYISRLRYVFSNAVRMDTTSLNNTVQSILAARLTDKRYPRCHHYKRIAQFAFHEKAAVKHCVKALTRNFEKIVDRWLMAFDLEIVHRNPQLFARKSQERLVLLSLAYQGIIGFRPNKSPLFPALGNAFLMDNRALAWYYLRYYSGAEESQAVMQRYYESELFSLYDAGVNEITITKAQAKEVYAMYLDYKQHIIDYEKRYSARIDEANRYFGLAGSKTIKNFQQNFSLAYNRLKHGKKTSTQPQSKQHNVHYLPAAIAR